MALDHPPSEESPVEVTELLPLSPRVFHILLAIASEPRNGYQIATTVLENSDGKVRLSTGTLYEALHRMTRQGLLQPAPKGSHTKSDGRNQRFYIPTDLGLAALRAEAERLSRDAALAQAALGHAS